MGMNEIEFILEFVLSWRFIKYYIIFSVIVIAILAIIGSKKNEKIKIFNKNSIFLVFIFVFAPPICLRLMSCLDTININNESVISGSSSFPIILILLFIIFFSTCLSHNKKK